MNIVEKVEKSLRDIPVEGEWNKQLLIMRGDEQLRVWRYGKHVVVGNPGGFVKMSAERALEVIRPTLDDVTGIVENRYVFDAIANAPDIDAAIELVGTHLRTSRPDEKYREALVSFRADEGLTKHDMRIRKTGARTEIDYARVYWIPEDYPHECRAEFQTVEDAILYLRNVFEASPPEDMCIQAGHETVATVLV